MRDYAKVSAKFWIGETGKKIRKCGRDAQVLACYLMTAPTSNMLGLYYLSAPTFIYETGIDQEGALKALASLIEVDFCAYDETSEVVWVYEMAAYQIAPQLDPKDKRCAGVQNEYDALPENKFLGAFFDRYKDAFHMTRKRKGDGSPFKAPSKPRAGAGAGAGAGNKKGAQERAGTFDASKIPLPDWLDASLWQRWCADRLARKKPITEEGAKEQLASLAAWRDQGLDPHQSIREAIAGGWQGLFQPKAQTKTGGMAKASPGKDYGAGVNPDGTF